jgi:S1-C subfamily serine protease
MKNIIIIFLAVIGGFLASYFYINDRLSEGFVTIERQEIIIKENDAIVKMIDRVENAVVSIDGVGSGIVVFSDGLIIVPASVFSPNSKLFVNGELKDYVVEKQNEDFVLLKIEGNGFPTLEFGDAKVGQSVFLVGSISNGDNIIKSVNVGIIKRIEEDFLITNILEESRLVGSSLFDVDGKVLGINILDESGFIKTIPAHKIQQFIGL